MSIKAKERWITGPSTAFPLSPAQPCPSLAIKLLYPPSEVTEPVVTIQAQLPHRKHDLTNVLSSSGTSRCPQWPLSVCILLR